MPALIYALPEAVSRFTVTLARRELPVTEVEKLHGEYRVANLMADWPFQSERQAYAPPAPTSAPEQVAQAWYAGQLDWIGAMNQAMLYYQRRQDYVEAARIALKIADSFPFEDNPQFVAGQMLVRRSAADRRYALEYFHRAAELAPRRPENLQALAQAYLLNGHRAEAADVARRLLEVAPGNELAMQMLQELE